MKVLLLGLLLIAGCSSSNQFSKRQEPITMIGTHKVWLSNSFLIYQDSSGFTCAHIDRSDNGYVYKAELVWATPTPDVKQLYFQEYNSLDEAEHWVEQWCKP
jgi:uncharacterized lipoprotein YajG